MVRFGELKPGQKVKLLEGRRKTTYTVRSAKDRGDGKVNVDMVTRGGRVQGYFRKGDTVE